MKCKLLSLSFALALCAIAAGANVPESEWTRSLQGSVGTNQTKYFPCVARIDVSGARGSATLVNKDGRRAVAITAYHVIRGTDGKGTISFANGERFPFTTLKTDKSNDAASLLIDGSPSVPGVGLAEKAPTPGDYFVLAGWGGTPRDGFFAAIGKFSKVVQSDHHVSGPGREIIETEFVPHAQVETLVSQGDSGGGAFVGGKLSGVISMGNAEFAVVAAHRPEILQRLLPPWGCPSGNCPSPNRPTQPPSQGGPNNGGGNGGSPPALTPPTQTPEPAEPIKPIDPPAEPNPGPFVPYPPNPPTNPGGKPTPTPSQGFDWWDLAGKGATAASAAFGFSIPFWIRGAWRLATGVRNIKRRRTRRRKRRRPKPEPEVVERVIREPVDRVVEREKIRVVATDTPPPPATVERTNNYVSYPTDKYSDASQWAKEQMVRKYPGAVAYAEMHDSLVRQYLGGLENGR